LTTPDGSQTFGPYAQAGTQPLVDAVSGSPFGLVDYVVGDPANGDNSVMIGLAPTVDVAPTAKIVAAPYGAWRLRLRNIGKTAARFHAWVQRDDLGKDGRRQQSCFVAGDADPRSTICDLAGGHLTISVGAFNVATSEVAAYSACGPTRDSAQAPSRGKPEACAPAEEIAIHGGVLSSASRLAPPCRITGTSAAAPHVAGIAALAFEYRRTHQNQHLTAKELRAALQGQAGGVPLVANRREALDARPLHQKDVFNDLVGLGKISCKGTLDKL